MKKEESGKRKVESVLIAFCLSFVQLSTAQSSESHDSLIVHYTDGVRLATEQRMEEAAEKFALALAIEPDHDPSLFEAANLLAAAGKTDSALVYSARAAALDPENGWYRGQQGRILVALSRYDEALEVFERTVADRRRVDPDDYRMLALLYYQKGRTDDALATLDSAGVRMGANPEIVEMKRGILLEAGRIDEGAAVTEEYVAGAPYDEENRMALAEIYAYQGRDSLYVSTLNQVVGINPDNAAALTSLADFYLAKGQTKPFLSALKQLFTLPSVPLKQKVERLESLTGNINFYRTHFFEVGDLALTLATQHTSDPRAVELYADHAVRGGDPEGALTMLKSRLVRNEPPLSTFMKAIQIEAYLERPDSVARWSDSALKLYPDEIEIYLLRSSALQYMKRPKEAQKSLSRALRVAATDSLRSEVYGAIGSLWHEEGDNKKTFAAYEKALRYNPDNALVLNNYAYYLAVEGLQLDRALGMAKRAVRLRENFATYLDTYAWTLYKTGDYAEARRVMQQALPLDREENPELLIHYGDILWALDEKFMASVYWKKARDAGWEPVADIEERLSRIKNQ